ncbi:putative uncharacterized protein DDB_G0278881, partial [Trichogramma pretiosum]|uniref:putative uncharacterized protein DDB_G0278881 n=1 Tax=Trichogramma pretiosum TaxID=7493 RepID=UPI000C71A45C
LENKTTTKIRSSNNQVSNQSPSGKQAILSHPTTSNNNSNNNNNGNSNSNKNRFNAVRFDRACNSKGGILFLIKSNIMYDTLELGLNDLEQIEIAAITIDTYPEPTNIIAYYRSPTHKPGMSISSWRDEWHAVIDKVNNINQLFFLGDFNAHHPWWGSNK